MLGAKLLRKAPTKGFYFCCLILPHGQLSIDFLDQIQEHRDYDEESRTTDRDRSDSCERLNERREYRDDTEEERTDERDASHHL